MSGHGAERGLGDRPRWRQVDGIVLLDKPPGLGSTPALQRVRRLLHAAKAGHAGTLDPMATGMLPLCFGQATKACGALLGSSKAYRATVLLGAATDTGDAEGRTVRTGAVPPLDPEIVTGAMARVSGTREQMPPMYSALKHQGRPLYELARRGEEVARTPRTVSIHRLDLLRLDSAAIDFEVVCSKGTYVRVLGEELAAALGTVGHLAALRRLWVEPFVDSPMVTLQEIEDWAASGPAEDGHPAWLLPVDAAFPDLPRVDLSPLDSLHLRQGRILRAPPALSLPGHARAYDESGRFLGLVEGDGAGGLRVARLFVGGASGKGANPA